MPNNSRHSCERCNANSGGRFRAALLAIQLSIYWGLPVAAFIGQWLGTWHWTPTWERVYYVSVVASLASQGVLRLPQFMEKLAEMLRAFAAAKAGAPIPEPEEEDEG